MRWRRRSSAEPVPSDVLVVCTGNVCRSPYIALQLAHRHPSLTVLSAGTGALVGSPPSAPSADLLEAAGIPVDDQVGVQVTRGLVAGASLILAATGAHRAAMRTLDPTCDDRCFTLLELARLVESVPPSGGLAGLVAAGVAARAAETVDHDDDLADPWQLPQSAYDAMAASVETALAVLDPWLAS